MPKITAPEKIVGKSKTGEDKLYARINEDFELELRIGQKGRYIKYFKYTNAYMCIWKARHFVKRLNCSELVVKSFPGKIPHR